MVTAALIMSSRNPAQLEPGSLPDVLSAQIPNHSRPSDAPLPFCPPHAARYRRQCVSTASACWANARTVVSNCSAPRWRARSVADLADGLKVASRAAFLSDGRESWRTTEICPCRRRLAWSMARAKPSDSAGVTFDVVMPITRPYLSTSGPPLFPGLIAASVCTVHQPTDGANRADDAARHRALQQTKWRSDGKDLLANLHALRATHDH